MKPQPPAAPFFRVSTAVLALLFASCQHPPSDKAVSAINKKTDQQRPASLEAWKTKTIRGHNALDYGSRAAAMLVPLDVAISLRTETNENGWTQMKTKFRVKTGKNYGFGSAVALTSDGYFLTAAHCVGPQGSTIQILAKTNSPPVSLSIARVVWRSSELDPNEPDLAVLYAPVRPEVPVRIAAQEELNIGLQILSSGYGSFKKSWAGGRILSIAGPRTAPTGITWREVSHSAPITPGDSGGPILSSEGKLVGINSQIVMSTSGWLPFGLGRFGYDYTICYLPDPDWLNSIIQRDRARRNAKHNQRK